MQLNFGKGLMAGVAGVAVVLAITAAANGTGVGAVFNLGQTNQVNATSTPTGKASDPTKVAYLNASLLSGISPAASVQGGGHVVTAQVSLKVGQHGTLFNLRGYGKFSVFCINNSPTPPFAEMDFTAGPADDLFTQEVGGSTGTGTSWQFMPKGSGLGLQTGLDDPEQTQWTILPFRSHLTGHLATVQTDFAVNNNNTSKCDFAAVAYAAP